MNKRWFVAVMAAACISSAWADVKAIVAYRQGVMKSFGGHMQALKAILAEGQKQFQPNALFHGEAILGLAKSIPDMFPQGSEHRKSAAKKEIWKNFPDFTSRAQTLERLSQEFVQAVKGGDEAAMKAAFQKMGKEGCSACHEKYRKD
ncbi:MAG: cytochrome c [Methylohalobius sp.]|nr:cytochrome c [Methylohalobius sp.]